MHHSGSVAPVGSAPLRRNLATLALRHPLEQRPPLELRQSLDLLHRDVSGGPVGALSVCGNSIQLASKTIISNDMQSRLQRYSLIA